MRVVGESWLSHFQILIPLWNPAAPFTTLKFILNPLLFILSSSTCLERDVIGIDFGREKPFDQAFIPCPLRPPGAVTPMLAHRAGLEWGLPVLIAYPKSGGAP